FYEFLHGVNATRKATLTQEEPIDVSPYTPDFYEQNGTFTEKEMELLTTAHAPEENLTREDLIADAETFFTLLKTTYGAYWYFGGDETFLPLLDAVKEDLAVAENPIAKTLENSLYQRLSPVLVDGHFQLGSYAMRETHSFYMYYVPDLYLDSIEDVENPDYIKPTIGPDGRICWWYAALSHDGSDLPDTLDGNPLAWKRAGCVNGDREPAFSTDEWEGIPILTSRRMMVDQSRGDLDQKALQDLASCGGEYAGSPLLIFDVCGNSGGSDQYINSWFRDWAGAECYPRQTFAHRYSQLSCRIIGNNYYPTNRMGTHRIASTLGTWAERSGPVFVLQDKGVASSGETAVKLFRSAEEALLVGGPTLGCFLTPNNISLYLPHSGLPCYFGTGLGFCETDENRDGVGFLPDLWVEPTQAMDAVEKLIGYYGLNTEQ
ncbi:MAG: hypothetical protein K2K53_09790, partial [Oscillospiraceae bacterium]|nr:hypothetical protein [Oscillospiraceae bacterium]